MNLDTKTLDDLEELGSGIAKIVTGGARGADKLAVQWANSRQVNRTIYLAKWAMFGRYAGLARNREMLDSEKPDLIVAFPGGKGTAHMVRIARQGGYEVTEITSS